MDEEIAVSSLKDRISRLEKFKENSSLENESKISSTEMVFGGSSSVIEEEQKKNDDRVSNLFDTLAREKERKVEQFDTRNRRNRAEIDNMTMEDNILQNQREQIIKDQARAFDFYDMEK